MAKKLGERLVEAGLVTAEAIEKALQQQKLTGHKLGDCLVEIGLLNETALLRFLAAEFNTRFVSTDKLSKVKIPPDVLDKVPVRMAEAQVFIPLALDPEAKILSVVMAEPQNEALLKEIALVTEMKEVYPYIALRSSIFAAIRKHYYSDANAFSNIGSQGTIRSDVSSLANAFDTSGRASAPGLRLDSDSKSQIRSATQISQPTQLREALGLVRGGALGENDFVETLNVLVGLLEMSRKEMRGHSAQLARQASMVARRMGLPPREVSHVAVAAYLHDLGKPWDRHLTVANAAHDNQWKADCKRYCRAPIKLFETVHLPVQVNAILAQVYEAYDGSGVPQGARGDDIAAGARIIAAVDSYLDLIKNPRNAFGRALEKDEALASLTEQSGKLYDPMVVDILGGVHSGELLRQRLEADGRQVLVAEPDEGTRTDLLEELTKRRMVTHSVAALDGVIDAMLRGDADLLLLGLRFGEREVAAICQFLRTRAETAGVPIVVVGEPPDNVTKDRLQQAGASGFVALPLDPTKAGDYIRDLYLDRIAHGAPARLVPGSFEEIAPIELFKLLGGGRKSGRLTFQNEGEQGLLQFEQGRVVLAKVGERSGSSALTALATLKQGEFTYDPNSILMEVPQLEQDFELIVRELAGGSPARSAAGA